MIYLHMITFSVLEHFLTKWTCFYIYIKTEKWDIGLNLTTWSVARQFCSNWDSLSEPPLSHFFSWLFHGNFGTGSWKWGGKEVACSVLARTLDHSASCWRILFLRWIEKWSFRVLKKGKSFPSNGARGGVFLFFFPSLSACFIQ